MEIDGFIKTLLESCPDAAVLTDPEFRIIFWNREADRLFKWKAREVLGQSLAEVVVPSARRKEFNDHFARSMDSEPETAESAWAGFCFQDKTGLELTLEATTGAAENQGRRICFAYFRGASKIKNLEEALLEKDQNVQKAEKAKTEFLARASHEIRTPLNSIIGFSDILLKMLEEGKVDESFAGYLRLIVESGEQLAGVIGNVLDLSKLESGTSEIREEAFDLKVVVKSLVTIFASQAREKGVELNYFMDENIKGPLVSDRKKLNQILTCLLSNAIKYTESGRATLGCQRKDNGILFQVNDTGPGIAPEKLAKIFEPFGSGGDSDKPEKAGAGLGLAVAKKAAEVLRGKIWAESKLNQGSRFYFWIPLGLEAAEDDGSPAETESPAKFLAGQKVLLVDDNEKSLLLTQLFLNRMGLKPETAVNGVEAVEKAVALQPDLILMDTQMPLMDGLEATRELRKKAETQNIPIIGISAHAGWEHEDAGMRAGLTAYLAKPLQYKKLETACRKFLKKAT